MIITAHPFLGVSKVLYSEENKENINSHKVTHCKHVIFKLLSFIYIIFLCFMILPLPYHVFFRTSLTWAWKSIINRWGFFTHFSVFQSLIHYLLGCNMHTLHKTILQEEKIQKAGHQHQPMQSARTTILQHATTFSHFESGFIFPIIPFHRWQALHLNHKKNNRFICRFLYFRLFQGPLFDVRFYSSMDTYVLLSPK